MSRKGRQDIDLANISQPERQTLLRPISRLSASWKLLWVVILDRNWLSPPCPVYPR